MSASLDKKIALLQVSWAQSLLVFSQVRPEDPDSSVFTQWVNTIKVRKEFNYIGVGSWRVNGKGETPLIFETQLRQDFLLYRGRSNQVPFLRSLMVNFDLGNYNYKKSVTVQ